MKESNNQFHDYLLEVCGRRPARRLSELVLHRARRLPEHLGALRAQEHVRRRHLRKLPVAGHVVDGLGGLQMDC